MVSNDEVTLSDPKNWPVEDEVHLLYSTLDNKPVGKNFVTKNPIL